MPSFLITSPEGKKYKITAPDGATKDDALAHFQSNFNAQSPGQPAQPATPPEPATEYNKAESGIAGYAQGLTGNFGDEIMAGLTAPVLWAGSKLVESPEYSGKSMGEIYSHERGKIDKDNQTAAQDNPWAYGIGNVGGALTTGAAGTTTKAGTALASSLRSGGTLARMGKGAAAGAASGAAYGLGGADEGARLEGALKGGAIGLVAGGAIPGVGAAVGSAAKGTKNAITGAFARDADDLARAGSNIKAASSQSYQQMRNLGATVNKGAVQRLLSTIDSEVGQTGKLNASLHGDYLSVMDDLRAAAAKGDLGIEEMDQFRQLLGDVVRKNTSKIDGASPAAQKASTAINALDDAIDTLKPTDLSGGGSQALQVLGQARADWQKYRKFDSIAQIIQRSEGDANYLKRELKKLADDPRRTRGWNQAERQALKEASRLTAGEGVLKSLGKFGFDFGNSRIGNTALPVIGGYLSSSAGLPVAGTLARQGQKYIARGKAEKLLEAIEGAPPARTPRPISPLGAVPAAGVIGNSMKEPPPAPFNFPKNDNTPVVTSESSVEPQPQAASNPDDFTRKLFAIESGGNPNAKATTSSATGAAQFIDSTWQHMVRRYGKQYGLTRNGRTDPKQAEIAAQLYAMENKPKIDAALGREAMGHELYLAHFLGSGGAVKLLKSNPKAIASQVLPSAAASNKNIFFDRKTGKPRTVSQVNALIQDKWDRA